MRNLSLMLAAAAITAPVATTPAFAQDGYYQGRTWQDSQGRLRCKRSNGTVGMIVGGAGGALVGRAIDTRGERATGTIIGAAAGALIGRQLDKSRKVRCR